MCSVCGICVVGGDEWMESEWMVEKRREFCWSQLSQSHNCIILGGICNEFTLGGCFWVWKAVGERVSAALEWLAIEASERCGLPGIGIRTSCMQSRGWRSLMNPSCWRMRLPPYNPAIFHSLWIIAVLKRMEVSCGWVLNHCFINRLSWSIATVVHWRVTYGMEIAWMRMNWGRLRVVACWGWITFTIPRGSFIELIVNGEDDGIGHQAGQSVHLWEGSD